MLTLNKHSVFQNLLGKGKTNLFGFLHSILRFFLIHINQISSLSCSTVYPISGSVKQIVFKKHVGLSSKNISVNSEFGIAWLTEHSLEVPYFYGSHYKKRCQTWINHELWIMCNNWQQIFAHQSNIDHQD